MSESRFDALSDNSLQLSFYEATFSLIKTIQDLSLTRDLDSITKIVRHAARQLTGADGATFVLRDGDKCYYYDEEAIAPLWKGQKFPMEKCISGWVMLNRQAVMIEDIYVDPRIPIDAYRPTFVKSILMVPIRTESPIGAIGNYWATHHIATDEEIHLLQALADSTSIAMENVQIFGELENRVKQRTVELEDLNKELEAFSYSVSHDLRAPLQRIATYSDVLTMKCSEKIDHGGKEYLQQIQKAVFDMSDLIDSLLMLSRVTSKKIQFSKVNLSQLAKDIAQKLKEQDSLRAVSFKIENDLVVQGDSGLLSILLENLLNNAWKYTSYVKNAVIEVGCEKNKNGKKIFFVRDNGAGFDMKKADTLFVPFKRLHTDEEFKGTGIGLATVSRVVKKHGGEIWAKAEVGKGATFYFSLIC
jgi:signal transduction histidine kinase